MQLLINKITIYKGDEKIIIKPDNKVIHALDKESFRSKLKREHNANDVYFDITELV